MHYGERGHVTEKHFLSTLRAYLPDRYSVDSAIVIDSNGKTSDQIDVVIYDRYYTPTLLDQAGHKYVPAEAVYCVMEVKPVVNRAYLIYAGRKASSVRRLKRTSVSFPTAGGTTGTKPPFRIVSGLVAAKPAWKEGFGKPFKEVLEDLKGKSRLDCVLAVSNHYFDTFDEPARPGRCITGKNVLIFFLFRLLKKLQTLGNVPGIDWDAYASQLIKKEIPIGG
jgi:hypothetical protein